MTAFAPLTSPLLETTSSELIGLVDRMLSPTVGQDLRWTMALQGPGADLSSIIANRPSTPWHQVDRLPEDDEPIDILAEYEEAIAAASVRENGLRRRIDVLERDLSSVNSAMTETRQELRQTREDLRDVRNILDRKSDELENSISEVLRLQKDLLALNQKAIQERQRRDDSTATTSAVTESLPKPVVVAEKPTNGAMEVLEFASHLTQLIHPVALERRTTGPMMPAPEQKTIEQPVHTPQSPVHTHQITPDAAHSPQPVVESEAAPEHVSPVWEAEREGVQRRRTVNPAAVRSRRRTTSVRLTFGELRQCVGFWRALSCRLRW